MGASALGPKSRSSTIPACRIGRSTSRAFSCGVNHHAILACVTPWDAPFLVGISAAGSDGRRNTGLQFTRGSFEAEGFSGALIQAQRDLVELRLRMDGQVGSSREVLPQQEIRVFVRAALPGTLWITEVDLNIRRYREVFVLGHLQPSIPGQ